MLQRANRRTKPAVVADGDQQLALRCQSGCKVGVDGLIADQGGEGVAGSLKWRLVGRAAAEAGHGQVEKVDQPAQQVFEWYVLAKGHQFLLQVLAAWLAAADHDAVVDAQAIGVLGVDRDAGDQRAALFGQVGGDSVDEILALALQNGHRCFRPDHQVGGWLGVGQVAIQLQGAGNVGRVPFIGLGDIGLHQVDAQALARWLGPVDVGQQQPPAPDKAEQQRRADQLQRLARQAPFAQQAGHENR